MLQVAVHLNECCIDQTACKQLLRMEPQLLPQLVALTAAALQQLAVQRDKEIEASRTAAILASTLGVLLFSVRVSPHPSSTPYPAEASNLTTMLHDTGE